MSEIIEKETIKQAVKPPSMFMVVLNNDDFTPMFFVIDILVEIFNKNSEDAEQIMLNVHKNGKGVAGTYTKDVALAKQIQAMDAARKAGHPLLITVEEGS